MSHPVQDDPAIGRHVTFTKTVSESDVYLFAGISGDLGPNHVDAEYMRDGIYGQRVAHGALLIAFMSTCSTKVVESLGNEPHVAYGYDRIRFIRPVFFGDTIRVEYTVRERDERGILHAQIEVFNQHREVVAAAIGLLKKV
jgi:3-hydroxybutyryl-CoA dehydratase